MKKSKNDKWTHVIGCYAQFCQDGKLRLCTNAKVVKTSGRKAWSIMQMIVKINRLYVYVSPDGVAVSRIQKKYVEIL